MGTLYECSYKGSYKYSYQCLSSLSKFHINGHFHVHKNVYLKILKRGKLFGGTVPPNNTLFGRTVLPNSTLFGGTPHSEKYHLIVKPPT